METLGVRIEHGGQVCQLRPAGAPGQVLNGEIIVRHCGGPERQRPGGGSIMFLHLPETVAYTLYVLSLFIDLPV